MYGDAAWGSVESGKKRYIFLQWPCRNLHKGNLFYIKDFLGHEDISTTEVYAKASIETQRAALEKHSIVTAPSTPSWATDTDTLEWLKSFGKQQ